ncbi:UNVERIFIED_CONTAM: hypothetical protein PYX00_000474 [Menopon gallinae]|uniref:Glycerol kinase 5 n=1 Tax=Menopon gallinae TaxID=328185 RepID=A0AAW2I950_9NEOP
MSEDSEGTRAPRIIMVGEQAKKNKFVAALDVGTTTIRCHIFDEEVKLRGFAEDQIELIYPQTGFVEIDNEKLWQSVVKVINDAIKDAGLKADDITCLGISVQRSSFTTWNRETGVAFHNIVTWRDIRAEKIVYNLNNSLLMKSMRIVSRFLYYVTRNERYLLGSRMKVMNTQVTPRLLWHLQNNYRLKEAVEKNNAQFGTLDTWLIYKLTGGKLHATDPSNASCTGFFDPFTMSWATWAFHVLHIPAKILPEVMDTADDFGSTSPDLFGAAIPIRSCVADQSASLFGNCCFSRGNIKITLGTGSFVDVNTGDCPHASLSGVYPVVAWRLRDETTYMAEGGSNDTGTTIKWAQKIGIIENPTDSSDLANSVRDTDGVCFVPSFSGLQAPVNDGLAAAGLIGIKPTTSKAHMIRAILESIVFRIEQLFQVMKSELDADFKVIRVDGGVSKNDFVCQLIADLTGTVVERADSTEMSVLGAVFLAGISAGVWETKSDLLSLRQVRKTFRPRERVNEDYAERVQLWQNAVNRFLRWYPEEC